MSASGATRGMGQPTLAVCAAQPYPLRKNAHKCWENSMMNGSAVRSDLCGCEEDARLERTTPKGVKEKAADTGKETTETMPGDALEVVSPLHRF